MHVEGIVDNYWLTCSRTVIYCSLSYLEILLYSTVSIYLCIIDPRVTSTVCIREDMNAMIEELGCDKEYAAGLLRAIADGYED